MRSIGRGESKENTRKVIQDKLDDRKNSISDYFSGIVTSKFKQDVSALLVGNKGTGKSYASLSIAYHTSVRIADILGGKPEDYFNIDHVACVDPTQANELMRNCKKNCCYLYDDIGVGWGARDWQSRSSKDKNNIFQINRISQTMQIFSVPNQFLLDKVPRSLVSHYMETDRQFFSKGFVTIKMFKPVTLFRASKIIQPLIATDTTKYVLYAVPKPPDDLVAEYDELRTKVTEELIKNGGVPDEAGGEKNPSVIDLKIKSKKERIAKVLPKYYELRRQGLTKSAALRKLAIPPSTWRSWNIQEQ